VRYVRYSPAILALICRTAVVVFFASALLALLPTVARGVSVSAIAYGFLLGCFGAGAVLGAVLMQPALSRWSTDVVASLGVVVVGATIVATGTVHAVSALGVVMLVAGGAWIIFVSLVNTLVQHLAPDWVRARVLAVFMLVFQGSTALGSAIWGAIGERAGLETALIWAGVGTIASTALGVFLRLPDAPADLSPWIHWRAPAILDGIAPGLDDGPVLVTVEYMVDRERSAEFVSAIHEYGRMRRRDGASLWGIFQDTEAPDRYLETFVVNSWAEHLRQHDRQTQADRELEERLRRVLRGAPDVHHLIYTPASSSDPARG
jgi:MFS family permease